MRVLFLLKKRHEYGSGGGFSSGLFNSAKFAEEMLEAAGISAELREVEDGNSVDREVTRYHPTHVIIEALWVTPEKVAELSRLHPHVRWIIRYHSDTPFLALEAVAVSWLKQYTRIRNVYVAANLLTTTEDFMDIIESVSGPAGKILYLPTFYPVPSPPKRAFHPGTFVSVSCPGAVRPFKNHLNQAIAAIRYAMWSGQVLRFHVNSGRVEQGGNAVLQNLRDLFSGTRHTLVEDDWLEHEAFVTFLRGMDFGLQVSFTETFDICAADMVAAGIPMVVSPQVYWSHEDCQADPTDVSEIVERMKDVRKGGLLKKNLKGLAENASQARKAWLHALRSV